MWTDNFCCQYTIILYCQSTTSSHITAINISQHDIVFNAMHKNVMQPHVTTTYFHGYEHSLPQWHSALQCSAAFMHLQCPPPAPFAAATQQVVADFSGFWKCCSAHLQTFSCTFILPCPPPVCWKRKSRRRNSHSGPTVASGVGSPLCVFSQSCSSWGKVFDGPAFLGEELLHGLVDLLLAGISPRLSCLLIYWIPWSCKYVLPTCYANVWVVLMALARPQIAPKSADSHWWILRLGWQSVYRRQLWQYHRPSTHPRPSSFRAH